MLVIRDRAHLSIGRAFSVRNVYRVPGVFEGDPPTEVTTFGDGYNYGMLPPRYPVPATMDNAVLALFHSREVTRWSVEWFKRELRSKANF